MEKGNTVIGDDIMLRYEKPDMGIIDGSLIKEFQAHASSTPTCVSGAVSCQTQAVSCSANASGCGGMSYCTTKSTS